MIDCRFFLAGWGLVLWRQWSHGAGTGFIRVVPALDRVVRADMAVVRRHRHHGVDPTCATTPHDEHFHCCRVRMSACVLCIKDFVSYYHIYMGASAADQSCESSAL